MEHRLLARTSSHLDTPFGADLGGWQRFHHTTIVTAAFVSLLLVSTTHADLNWFHEDPQTTLALGGHELKKSHATIDSLVVFQCPPHNVCLHNKFPRTCIALQRVGGSLTTLLAESSLLMGGGRSPGARRLMPPLGKPGPSFRPDARPCSNLIIGSLVGFQYALLFIVAG